MPRVITGSRWTALALVAAACSHILIVPTRPLAQVANDRARNTVSSPPPGTPASGRPDLESNWANVHIEDVFTRDAAKRALRGASLWLARPKCQRLFEEFKDERNLPLKAKLGELKADPQRYLHIVLFLDGSQAPTCQRRGILAFTAPGSRIVYICGREFERGWRRDPREVQATLIHEMLHSLGLGENPPTPRNITDRVQRLCWD